jgi:hypothetical protein
MQMDHLEAASETLGGRARSLDCRRFLGDPGPVLRALDDFLGLGPDIDAVLASTAQAFPRPPQLAPPLEVRRN